MQVLTRSSRTGQLSRSVLRDTRSQCVRLFLQLPKVPIFGPGGGVAPLEGTANPAYNVAVLDDATVAAQDKAAKDADLARLYLVNS
jgi:hypothetical protein